MSGLWSKPWIAKATKATKFGVVRLDAKEFMIWWDVIECGSGKPVYKVNGCGEGKWPVWQRHGSMGKKGQTSFNYVMMTTLRVTIVFRCMWGRNEVRHTIGGYKSGECLIFSPIVRVKGYYFVLKLVFYQGLKTNKDIKHIWFSFEWLKPHIFSEVIHKNNIVFEITHWWNWRRPCIRKDNF